MKKILIINTPCHGFGDIIFGWKIAKYLREWYGSSVDVKIATTLPESLMKLGEDEKYILKLKSKKESAKQCRRLSRLTLTNLNDVPIIYPNYDIYLVAPLQADFKPDYADIRSIFKNSTRENTFFFSEYNDVLNKGFNFNTGVGGKRVGLLFTDVGDISSECLKKYKLKIDNYALAYIAETIVNSKSCYKSFFEMLSKKYKNMDFQIVCPEWIANDLMKNRRKIENLFFKNFDQVEILTKTNSLIAEGGKGTGKIYIRGDILPVPNEEMLSLMKYSVKDILLTGDQSITDALACCGKNKNIFYQIAPWKKNLANNLAKFLPKFSFQGAI